MGNILVYKLLRRHVNAWQLAGFALANLCGMTIILAAIQFASDVIPLFTRGDSFLRPGQVVVTKRVSALRTLTGSAPVFREREIEELREQPFVRDVGLFTPSQFGVYATVGSRSMGMEFATEMFFESLPDAFIDVDLERWHYVSGSDSVPIILPRNYLNLYNFGFAGSQGLPALSETLVRQVGIRLRLTGTHDVRFMRGNVVAFSRKLNTILVPQSFMDEMNASLSPERTFRPSRLAVITANSADDRLADYLQKKGYDTEGGDADASKTAGFLRLVTTAVAAVGVIICILSFYVLLLSIFLLLQKNTTKIDNLLLIGYSPSAVARPFHLVALGLNAVVLVLSLWITFLLRGVYLPRFGELYPRFEPSATLPTLVTAISLFLLVALLNYTAVRRKITAIWNIHK